MADIGPRDVEKDLYAVLGVSESASEKEIKQAYRKLAQRYHPDKHPGDKEAEERFKEISHAYDILSNPEKRKQYDEARRLLRSGVRFQGPFFGDFSDDLFEQLQNLGFFGDLFGTGFSRSAGGRQARARGKDLHTTLDLSFEEAAFGTVKTLEIPIDAPCRECGGSGAAPGESPKRCPQCGGRGVQETFTGGFGFRRTCGRCGGRGEVLDKPCPVCEGSGMEQRRERIKVKIPSSVDDGSTVRVKGKGAYASPGGTRGDLYVHIRVKPHPLFRRQKADLLLDLPVTFAEAALGARIDIPTLDGPVTVKVPAGTQDGTVLRVKGKGSPKPDGGRGDLYVKVRVRIPQALSAKEREVLERFAELHKESPRRELEEFIKTQSASQQKARAGR
jgi:molecular chaperone DnaJ